NERQHCSRSTFPGLLLHVCLQVVLLQANRRAAGLTPCDLVGQPRDGAEPTHAHRAADEMPERLDRGARLQEDLHHPAAARVKTRMIHAQPQTQSELFKVRSPGDVEEMKAGTLDDVRAASQRQLAGAVLAEHQWQVQRVQYQAGRAGGADVETILAWL